MLGILKRLSLTAVMALFMGTSFAQTPVIHQDWTSFEESSKFLDVAYCIVQCTPTSKALIHLELMNENHNVTHTTFVLHIKDVGTGQTKDVTVSNYNIPYMHIHRPECTNADYQDLRIEVPSGFNPADLTLEITYK